MRNSMKSDYFFVPNLQSEWRRQWQPTPVLLPGKSHGRRSLVGCSPWGREELDTTEWLHFHFSLSCIGEGNGNPLQCSCLENPRDGGAWWAAIYGVAQSRTRLKRLSSSKEGIYVIRILLAKSLKRYSPNLNHTKIRNSFGSEILAYICTLQGDSAGKRLIILRSFILVFSPIICLQLHHPQTDLKRYTYGSGLWAVSCGQE